MRKATKSLMVLSWGAVFAVPIVLLMLCMPLVVMSAAMRHAVRESFVWVLPIFTLLGLGLAALGLLPGTRRRTKVLVRAFSNGTTTFVPVDAERVGSLVFRILGTDTPKGTVTWEFWQGETVRCEPRVADHGGKVLVAVERVT
jgi:MYXO-CTERM domain-containing protein